jgi:hypothetical protein
VKNPTDKFIHQLSTQMYGVSKNLFLGHCKKRMEIRNLEFGFLAEKI